MDHVILAFLQRGDLHLLSEIQFPCDHHHAVDASAVLSGKVAACFGMSVLTVIIGG